jgi:homoserine dehydrogenase
VLNGTCAYLIGELERGVGLRPALAEAQRLGYAEADPSLDVDGIDAAHKLTLLAR